MKVEAYERRAIEVLCAGVVAPSALYAAINDPARIECRFTGAGCYLDIQHPGLPEGRVVLTEPTIVGIYQEKRVGFVVFLENHTLTLECHSYGSGGVPPEIRNGTVQVSIA